MPNAKPMKLAEPFNTEQVQDLSAKLDKTHVSTRSQAGRKLSYIEGWHAIAEANRIFGFDGWSRETISMDRCCEPEQVNGNWRVRFVAKVRIQAGGTFRDGTGYGSGINKDLGEAYEGAVKEAETDAMKRALMTFGNPFGLALYDKTQANVEADAFKAPAAEQASPVERKSQAAHKRDGTFEDICAEIRATQTPDELREWGVANRARMQSLPSKWMDPARDAYANHMDELNMRFMEKPNAAE
jgi:DNA repair and recombination protein RAD52